MRVGIRRYFDRNARKHAEASYRQSQRTMIKFSVVTLLVMLPISVAASFSQYCLTPREILYQPWPWTGLEHYSWKDVAMIETSCARGGRGGWNTSFFLIMKDNANFDLMVWPRSLDRAYPEIVYALSDVEFTFNSARVSPGCDVPFVHLLLRRP